MLTKKAILELIDEQIKDAEKKEFAQFQSRKKATNKQGLKEIIYWMTVWKERRDALLWLKQCIYKKK